MFCALCFQERSIAPPLGKKDHKTAFKKAALKTHGKALNTSGEVLARDGLAGSPLRRRGGARWSSRRFVRSAARCVGVLVAAEGGQVSEANNGEAEADNVCQAAGVCPLSAAAMLGERVLHPHRSRASKSKNRFAYSLSVSS